MKKIVSKRAGKIKIVCMCVCERDIDREREEVCLSVVCLLRVGIRYADFVFHFAFPWTQYAKQLHSAKNNRKVL